MLWIRKRNLSRSLTQRVKHRSRIRYYVLWGFLSTMVATLVVLFFLLFTFWTYADGLIATDRLVNRQFRGLIMYDQSGNVIYESGVQYRSGNIPLQEIPQKLKEATVAVEDKDFYKHIGFSLPAMLRAFFANTQEGEIVQGASTITQQLVKNALLGDSSVRYIRKLREITLAFAIEYRYSKEELLGLYMNSIYYGRGAWGIGDAAKNYFGKNVKDLSDAESTFLAGLPQSPSRYGANLSLAKDRHNQVLTALVSDGYLDSNLANKISQSNLNFVEYQSFSVKYPFFTLAVREELIKLVGIEQQMPSATRDEQLETLVSKGLYVYTTLNSATQELTETAVKVGVAELSDRNVDNGASMVLDATSGAIRAYVGSKDWYDDENQGKYDVLDSVQQPGSTLKPLVYAAALNEGVITTASVLKDVKKDFNGYSPVNYDGRFRGNVTVDRALANSLNVPAVEVMQKLGMNPGVKYLLRLGIESLRKEADTEPTYSYAQDYGLSLVLGGYEMHPKEVIGAYTALAGNGVWHKQYMIERVTDRFGTDLYRTNGNAVQVFKPGVTEFVFRTLSNNALRREAFGERAENLEIPGKNVAVKTGTTDDYRDSWAIGYDNRYVVGVWLGNNDNSPMNEVAGSVGGASVWKKIFMSL